MEHSHDRRAERGCVVTRARLAVALAATCALTAALGAPPASAAVTCSLAGTTLTITVSATGDAASIERSGSEIVVNSGSVACNVAPTVTNTDRIVVNDTSAQGTRLRIDVGGGPFAPGASDEAGVSDEIEIQANMGDGLDSLVLIGSPFGDVWRLGKTAAGDGVNLNAGSETSGVVPGRDFDLEYFGVDGRLLVNGNASGDTVLANGGPEFTGPLTNALDYADLSGNDTVVGTDGADILEPGPDDDDVSGGAGDDRYVEADAQGDDDVDGGAGRDLLEHAGSSDASLRVDLRLTRRQDTGLLGQDIVTGVEDVFGGPGDDVLIGTDESNFLAGGNGDDLILGLGGTLDTLAGALGTDTLSYATLPAGASQGVTVDLELLTHQDTGGAGTDEVFEFESVIGSPFADTLLGSAVANRFEIRDGAGDNVSCRGGADTVVADVEGVDTIAADCETPELDVRPDTRITSGPPSLSNDATPSFAFVSDKAGPTFECSLDGGVQPVQLTAHARACLRRRSPVRRPRARHARRARPQPGHRRLQRRHQQARRNEGLRAQDPGHARARRATDPGQRTAPGPNHERERLRRHRTALRHDDREGLRLRAKAREAAGQILQRQRTRPQDRPAGPASGPPPRARAQAPAVAAPDGDGRRPCRQQAHSQEDRHTEARALIRAPHPVIRDQALILIARLPYLYRIRTHRLIDGAPGRTLTRPVSRSYHRPVASAQRQ
jgi:hypothetical protein